MKVKVKFLSLYRDVVGMSETELNVSEHCTIAQVVNRLLDLYPKLKNIFDDVPPIIFVEDEIAKPDKIVDRDIEIAIAPPASGGVNIKVGLFEDDIYVDNIIRESVCEGVGAVAVFVGLVKDVIEGHRVHELFYEAYEPYVVNYLERIAKEEMNRYNLCAVQIYHRIGAAKPGQKTIVIAVSARSRREALEALSTILERIKKEAPIYKLERREDGEYWIIGDGKRVPRPITV